jgi:site-specific recombinase XerD
VWLEVLARYLGVKHVHDLDSANPIFCLQIRDKNGTRRAIARETAWRILEEVVGGNELTGKIGTHSMRKAFASHMYNRLERDLVKVQRAMRHSNIHSTVNYLSFREEEVLNAILAA